MEVISARNVFFAFSVIVMIGCQKMKEENVKRINNKVFVIDDANLLRANEHSSLQRFMDSIAERSSIDLAYCSQLNEQKFSVDSIAEKQFQRLWISEQGVLVFLSKGNATVKILVGKKIHEKISDEELTEITGELLPYFKQGLFLDGIKYAFVRINDKNLSK
jgi:uncharacterized membrane protein YgcG